MIRRITRGLLLSIVFVVLSYVTVNVALNLSPLRSALASSLERESDYRVEVGYFFLNWKLQPVMDAMTLTETGSTADSRSTYLELTHLSLRVDWSRFFESNRTNLRRYVDSLRVRRVEARYRLTGSVGQNRVGSPTFEVPVTVDSWDLTVTKDSTEVFQLSGRKLTYRGRTPRLETQLTEYQHQRARGTIRLDGGEQGWSGRADLEELSFANDVWQIHGDEWSGELNFDGRSDTPTLDAQLSGTPGRLGGVRLPDVDLRSSVLFSGSAVTLDAFETSSKYFRSSLGGTISAPGEGMNLEGSFNFDLKDHLNDVLSVRLNREVEVLNADPIQGSLTIGGSVSDPDPRGVLKLSGAEVLLDTRGGTSVFVLSNLRGELGEGRLSLVNGRVRESTKSFSLNNGFLDVEDGRVTISATGTLTMNPGSAPESAFYPGRTEHLRSVRDVKFPMNFSGTFGTRNAETVLAVRDGTFRYGPGLFEKARLLYTYSTGSTRENSLRASVIDPDGNEWKINGPARGPYKIEGRPGNLQKWVHFYTAYPRQAPVPTFTGVRVRGTVPSFEQLRRSKVRLTTESAATVGVSSGTAALRSSIKGDSTKVFLETLELTRAGGQLDSSGSIRLDDPLEESELSVQATANRFPLSLVTSRYPALVGTRASGNLVGTGPITSPSVRGNVLFDTLSYQYLDVRNLGFRVEHRDTRTVISEARGTINGGTVTGGARVRQFRTFDLNGAVRSVDISSLLPTGSWMYRHSTGALTGRVQLTGAIGEPGSLNGEFRGQFNRLILDYFPEIKGIEQIARPEILENPIIVDPFEFTASVEDGRILLQEVTLKARGMRLEIGGVIDLKGDVDLVLDLVLRDEALRGFLQDVFGDVYRRVGIGNKNKLTIPLEVRGDIESPKFIVRRSEVSTNFRKNLVENFLSEPIGKPINELLDELFFVD